MKRPVSAWPYHGPRDNHTAGQLRPLPRIGPRHSDPGCWRLEADKWLALGETRKAATLCKMACGPGTIQPLPLAKGPDGTKCFRRHHTVKAKQPKTCEGIIGRA